MTKEEKFNTIKSIIEHPKNESINLVPIRNLIEGFESEYGVCTLSMKLIQLQSKLIKKV